MTFNTFLRSRDYHFIKLTHDDILKIDRVNYKIIFYRNGYCNLILKSRNANNGKKLLTSSGLNKQLKDDNQ
jgi:hypothetical protein